MPLQILRIIDANCNRIGEGLRFLEDVARFLLNDAGLTSQLKQLRHNLVTSLSQFGPALISLRNADADVGVGTSITRQQNISSLVTANARRAEEGFRVVEELSKLPELSSKLRSKDFEAMRFILYTLQRELLSRVTRRHKMERLTGLYVIIDTQTLGPGDPIDAARKAIRGGAKVIQLRSKDKSKTALLMIARQLSELCRKSGVLFIVNDFIDIAIASEADGIHVGQDDLPIKVIRQELPVDSIIGLSVTTAAQARTAEKEGADYVAVSAVFPSPTKPEARAMGLEGLRRVKKAVSIPVVAIGGINRQNMHQVLFAGVDSVACISAVLSQKDMEAAARQLVQEIEKRTKNS
ncbi:MAG TPA: thiamine phosphate synthase [Dehalococcoidia bacterium]